MFSNIMLPSNFGTCDVIKIHAHPIFHALIGMFSYLTDNYQGRYNNAQDHALKMFKPVLIPRQ